MIKIWIAWSAATLIATGVAHAGCPELLGSAKPETTYEAHHYIHQKSEAWLNALLQEPVRPFPHGAVASIAKPTTRALHEWLYDQDLLRANEYSRLLSDKLFLARLFRDVIGSDFDRVHPPFAGLKEFLAAEDMVAADGKITADRSSLRKALKRKFPTGVMLKPTRGYASAGKGFVVDEDRIVDLILRADPKYGVTPKDFAGPNPTIGTPGTVLSGENWYLMGKIDTGVLFRLDQRQAKRAEFRVHTLWGDLVPGGTENRFYLIHDFAKRRAAENMVEDILSTLPPQLTQYQAWGFDVIVDDADRPWLIEVNTNRGEAGSWSGFIAMPNVTTGYVEHLEKKYAWNFTGETGQVFRSGLGNFKSYFKGELERWHGDATHPPDPDPIVIEELEEFFLLYIVPLARLSAADRALAPVRQAEQIGREIQDRLKDLKKGHSKARARFQAWAKRWIEE